MPPTPICAVRTLPCFVIAIKDIGKDVTAVKAAVFLMKSRRFIVNKFGLTANG